MLGYLDKLKEIKIFWKEKGHGGSSNGIISVAVVIGKGVKLFLRFPCEALITKAPSDDYLLSNKVSFMDRIVIERKTISIASP